MKINKEDIIKKLRDDKDFRDKLKLLCFLIDSSMTYGMVEVNRPGLALIKFIETGEEYGQYGFYYDDEYDKELDEYIGGE